MVYQRMTVNLLFIHTYSPVKPDQTMAIPTKNSCGIPDKLCRFATCMNKTEKLKCELPIFIKIKKYFMEWSSTVSVSTCLSSVNHP